MLVAEEAVISRDRTGHLEFWRRLAPLASDRPATMRAALVVGPEGFRVDPDGSPDNKYVDARVPADAERARAQHRRLVEALGEAGLPVLRVRGLDDQPDAVFVNNAFATIPRRLIAGSMRHPGRRAEPRRREIRELFEGAFGYEIVDLAGRGVVAELTGPLVIDRPRGIGFCGRSLRADAAGCEAMHEAFGLRLTFDLELQPDEYHANVVLAVLAGRAAVVRLPAFREPQLGELLHEIYEGRVLELSEAEVRAFAGNCLAVTERIVMMSERAADALAPAGRRALESWGFALRAVDVSEFEKAGGSLRCLVAEIF